MAQRAADGTWAAGPATDSLGEDILPETDGTMVTYASNAGGDYDIWFKDVDGTNERTLVLTDAPGSIETNPTISGGAILFEREVPGSTDADLTSTGSPTNELLRVTETPDGRDAQRGVPDAHRRSPGRLGTAGRPLPRSQRHPRRPRPAVGQHERAAGPAAAGSGHGRRGRTVGCPVSYAATATDDGTATVTCAPASGATFAIGTTTVTCTAVDDDGATATGSFTVAVRGAREQLARFLVALTGVAPTSSHAATITTVVNRLPDRSLTLACEPLRLISKVLEQQSGRLVPADRAAALIADATRIRAVLACP